MSRIYVNMTRVSFGRFPDATELRIKLLGTFYGCLVSKLFLLHEIHFPSRYLGSKLKVTELRGIISWSTGKDDTVLEPAPQGMGAAQRFGRIIIIYFEQENRLVILELVE